MLEISEIKKRCIKLSQYTNQDLRAITTGISTGYIYVARVYLEGYNGFNFQGIDIYWVQKCVWCRYCGDGVCRYHAYASPLCLCHVTHFLPPRQCLVPRDASLYSSVCVAT